MIMSNDNVEPIKTKILNDNFKQFVYYYNFNFRNDRNIDYVYDKIFNETDTNKNLNSLYAEYDIDANLYRQNKVRIRNI